MVSQSGGHLDAADLVFNDLSIFGSEMEDVSEEIGDESKTCSKAGTMMNKTPAPARGLRRPIAVAYGSSVGWVIVKAPS